MSCDSFALNSDLGDYMQTIKELSPYFGWTEPQLRIRLERFNPFLDGHVSKGGHNRLLVSPNGVAILQRIRQLETEGKDFGQIEFTLKTDFQSPKSGENTAHSQIKQESSDPLFVKVAMEEKERLITQLESRINDQKQQIDFLQGILNSKVLQLPAPKEEKAGRWFRFKQLIAGK